MASSIGFIGVGIMGKGMIKNLVTKLNRHVVIWNRGVDASNEMHTLYPSMVTVAATPAEVIQKCTTTFCMLSTPEASTAVFDEPHNGVFAAVTSGKVIVDCATLTPERMVEEDKIVTSKGGKFLEAPVSGSKVQADGGQLIFLCGGHNEVFEMHDVKSGLEAMGKASFLFGDVGKGTEVKLVVNMMLGTLMASLAEGCSLASAADIPLDKLMQVLDLGALASPLFKGKGAKIISGDYDPHFPLKHQQKDLKFAIDLGHHYNLKLPTTEAANEVYVKAIKDGKGDDDMAAVYLTSKDLKK